MDRVNRDRRIVIVWRARCACGVSLVLLTSCGGSLVAPTSAPRFGRRPFDGTRRKPAFRVVRSCRSSTISGVSIFWSRSPRRAFRVAPRDRRHKRSPAHSGHRRIPERRGVRPPSERRTGMDIPMGCREPLSYLLTAPLSRRLTRRRFSLKRPTSRYFCVLGRRTSARPRRSCRS